MATKNLGSEAANRAAKTMALVGAILIQATLESEDVFAEGFVRKLESKGDDYWRDLAEIASCTEPSQTTRDAVAVFFRATAAKRRALTVPTQAGAEA